jgi:hypothetical protein
MFIKESQPTPQVLKVATKKISLLIFDSHREEKESKMYIWILNEKTRLCALCQITLSSSSDSSFDSECTKMKKKTIKNHQSIQLSFFLCSLSLFFLN